MFSNKHINVGSSSDDLFFKSRNPNNLSNKFNKFLISSYLPNDYNYSIFNRNPKNYEKPKDSEEPIWETNIYYPKPNYYNNIYTQRYSKKYQNFYSPNNYSPNPKYYKLINNYEINNKRNIIQNTDNNQGMPKYQIRKEIRYEHTPEPEEKKESENNYKKNNKLFLSFDYENKYKNDYYNMFRNNKREESPIISEISRKNFLNINPYKNNFEVEEQKRRRRLLNIPDDY